MAKRQTTKDDDIPELDPSGERFVCAVCGAKIEQSLKHPDTGWVCETCYFGHGIGEGPDANDD